VQKQHFKEIRAQEFRQRETLVRIDICIK